MSSEDLPYNNLGFLLGRTSRLMGRHMRQHLSNLEIDLDKEHWIILMYLRMQGPSAQQEIADFFFKDKGTIARSINQLQKVNLTLRKIDPKDKRQRLIHLTPKGEKLCQHFPPIARQMEQQAFRGISEEEEQAFKATFKKIYSNLK